MIYHVITEQIAVGVLLTKKSVVKGDEHHAMTADTSFDGQA